MTPKRSLTIAGLFVALILLILIVDKSEDWLTHVEYPLNVWRMDLDDIAANIGLFLVGVAAFVTVFKKADQASRKADQVSQRVNGGLQQAAREHVQDSEVIIGLVHRLDKMEGNRDLCLEELAELRVRIDQL